MAFNRYGKNIISEKEKINLTNGPAKLCEALKIKREENGLDLTKEQIFLIEGEKIPKQEIVATKRIGIKKSVELPWRFYIKDNPYVSQK
jgi:DNA-3-methyladenine glycosylase